MTNKEIRVRARALLLSGNFWRIGLVILFVMLVPTLVASAVMYVAQPNVELVAWVSMLISIAFVPLMPGLVGFLYGVWQGEAPALGRLFAFYRAPGLFARSLALPLVYMGVSMLPFFAMALLIVVASGLLSSGAPSPDSPLNMLPSILMLAFYPLMIFFVVRFSASPLAFVRDPEHRVIGSVKASWHATKRSVWRIIAMTLMVMLPLFLVSLVLSFVGAHFVATGDFGVTAVQSWLLGVLVLVSMSFYYGYPMLALTGLLGELLDGRGAPEREPPELLDPIDEGEATVDPIQE